MQHAKRAGRLIQTPNRSWVRHIWYALRVQCQSRRHTLQSFDRAFTCSSLSCHHETEGDALSARSVIKLCILVPSYTRESSSRQSSERAKSKRTLLHRWIFICAMRQNASITCFALKILGESMKQGTNLICSHNCELVSPLSQAYRKGIFELLNCACRWRTRHALRLLSF
jgi:hypothetical protein